MIRVTLAVVFGLFLRHSRYSAISRYFLPAAHFSSCSMSKAPMSRITDSRLGKMRMTRSRRRTSSFNRSTLFVVLRRLRYFSGRLRTAVASSNPHRLRRFVLVCRKRLLQQHSGRFRVRRLQDGPYMRVDFILQGSRMLRIKCVWHRCQVAPCHCARIERTSPP